jgi:hypothetical protein
MTTTNQPNQLFRRRPDADTFHLIEDSHPMRNRETAFTYSNEIYLKEKIHTFSLYTITIIIYILDFYG